MDEAIQFRHSIQDLPLGEALTSCELEQKLLDALHVGNGTCLDALWSLAVLYQQMERFDQSSDCIQRVIELTNDPEKIGSGYLALGQLEEKRGDFFAATRQYRKALAMEPCSAQTWYFIHNNLGYSLSQIGEHESAIPYLRQAIEIDADRPNAYKNLALAQEALGDLEQAVSLFITATQINATDSRSLAHLDSLLESNPVLEVDVPGLRGRVEMCREAVKIAKKAQPDLEVQ